MADVVAFMAGQEGGPWQTLTPPLSLPKRHEPRRLLIRTVGAVYWVLEVSSATDLPTRSRASVVFKVASHLSRVGAFSATAPVAALHTVLQAAVMMREQPRYITEPINIAKMAMLYGNREVHRERLLAFQRPAIIPPRPVLWSSLSLPYAVTELIHPWHLIDEGAAVGHCLNTRMRGNPRIPTPEDLDYWWDILEGQARLYAIEVNGVSICTMNVSPATGTLSEAEGVSGTDVLTSMPMDLFIQAIRVLGRVHPNLSPGPKLPPEVSRCVAEAVRDYQYSNMARIEFGL